MGTTIFCTKSWKRKSKTIKLNNMTTENVIERVPVFTPNKYRGNNRANNKARFTQVIHCKKTGRTKFIKHLSNN